jgi:alkylation response protein AidB-like acyl-CoA dehydrogenase
MVDIALSDEQALLTATAQRFLQRHWPVTVARRLEMLDTGHDPLLWDRISELGWPGLMLPIAYGGSGQGVLEVTLLAEQLGKAPSSSPLLTSSMLTGLPILWAGSAEQRGRWLPGLATGRVIGAPCILEEDMQDEWAVVGLRGHRDGAGWRLSGTKVLVPYASSAHLLLVVAQLDDVGTGLLGVESGACGVGWTRQATLGGDPLFAVTFDGVEVQNGHVVAAGVDAERTLHRALDHAAVAAVGYAVGLGEAALALSLRHATDRVQFGKPIGAFQAVAHRCVEIRSDIDACRMLGCEAAWRLDRGDRADLAVAAAKAYTNEAMRRAFVNAHQVHGAIGFSLEHDLQLYTRRAKAFELSYGGGDRHRARAAQAMARL